MKPLLLIWPSDGRGGRAASCSFFVAATNPSGTKTKRVNQKKRLLFHYNVPKKLHTGQIAACQCKQLTGLKYATAFRITHSKDVLQPHVHTIPCTCSERLAFHHPASQQRARRAVLQQRRESHGNIMIHRLWTSHARTTRKRRCRFE